MKKTPSIYLPNQVLDQNLESLGEKPRGRRVIAA